MSETGAVPESGGLAKGEPVGAIRAPAGRVRWVLRGASD